MTSAQQPGSDALEAARKRRRQLHAVLVDVERSLARPAPGREDQWLDRVREELVRLQESFEEHVHGTEGDEGLFAHIVSSAPRLANGVRRLEHEHEEIRDAIRDTVEALESGGCPDEAERVGEVRDRVLQLLHSLSRHRQAGSDLVYEAFETDIGWVD